MHIDVYIDIDIDIYIDVVLDIDADTHVDITANPSGARRPCHDFWTSDLGS